MKLKYAFFVGLVSIITITSCNSSTTSVEEKRDKTNNETVVENPTLKEIINKGPTEFGYKRVKSISVFNKKMKTNISHIDSSTLFQDKKIYINQDGSSIVGMPKVTKKKKSIPNPDYKLYPRETICSHQMAFETGYWVDDTCAWENRVYFKESQFEYYVFDGNARVVTYKWEEGVITGDYGEVQVRDPNYLEEARAVSPLYPIRDY